MQQRAHYLAALNKLLEASAFPGGLTHQDFHFLESAVVESSGRFSRQIVETVWPAIHKGEFFHYTDRAGAEGIIRSQTLRLHSVKKRLHEQELRSFLERFNYRYPLSIDPTTGEPRYAGSLGDERFYISLCSSTITAEEEKILWNTFCLLDGARFRIRIESPGPHLREIAYGDSDKIRRVADLLDDLNELTAQMLGKIFHWDESSYVCALHLPPKYQRERETRLLFGKNHGLPTQNDGSYSYLALKFGQTDSPPISLAVTEIVSDSVLANTMSGAQMKLRN